MKTILVIEDSPDARLLYENALAMENYRVRMAGNGQEAIEDLQNNTLPDLILLDLSMPGMSGTEFLKLLRATHEWSAIKVIVVSGRDNLKLLAKEIGANGYIKKPFDLSSLYAQLESCLR